MLEAKGKVIVNIDHCYPYIREAYVVLKKTGTLHQALFKGDPPTADSVRKDYGSLIDSITYMPVIELTDNTPKNIISEFQVSLHPPVFELVFDRVNYLQLEGIPAARKNGARLWINTLWPELCAGHDDDLAVEKLNIKDSWEWALTKGFTIIQTDRPQALLNYLRKRKLHQ